MLGNTHYSCGNFVTKLMLIGQRNRNAFKIKHQLNNNHIPNERVSKCLAGTCVTRLYLSNLIVPSPCDQ